MAAFLKLDTLRDAGFTVNSQMTRFRRTGIVYGIDTSNPALVPYLASQATGMPQYGDAHPAKAEATLEEIDCQSIPDSPDAIRVMLTYTTPTTKQQSSQGGKAWVVEDDTGLTGETTELVPGKDKSPIVVSWRDPVTLKYYDYQGSIQFLRPIRNVTLSGATNRGVALEAVRGAQGKVNGDKWNGLDPGYWLLSGLRTRTSDGGRTYSVSVQMTSRQTEDWSTYQVLRDRNTDQFVTVKKADVDGLKAKPYAYGLVLPDGKNEKGIIKIGPYETVSFNNIFGI